MTATFLGGWAKIASGNAATGLLRIGALAIAAQSLGASAVGVLVIIEAYARVVDGLVNFQSVHVMTNLLADAQHAKATNRFRGLVKAGLLVDVATAFGACVLGVVLLPVLGPLFGVPNDWTGLAMLFCIVIVSRAFGTPEAIFRCFDRYWAIGFRETTAGVLIVGASLLAWGFQAGAITFLLIWLFSQIVANLMFVLWSFVVLRRKHIRGIRRGSAKAAIRSSPGFWRTLTETNLTFGIRTLSQDGDVLIAGALLGSGAAGLLRAAKNVAGIVSQSGRPLHQVASATITRLWAARKMVELLAYTRNISIVAAAVGLGLTLLFAVVGETVISRLFGPDFAVASSALTIIMLANAIYLSGVTLLPTMVATGDGRRYLYGVALGTLAFVAVITATARSFGITGVALAHVAFNSVWAVYCWRVVIRRLEVSRVPWAGAR